jgi:hypothetical protein
VELKKEGKIISKSKSRIKKREVKVELKREK